MPKSTTTLNIGELAKQSDTGAVTIRYYEKRGLIHGVLRSAGGHRLYDDIMLTRLHFIRNAKLVGFSLDEIAELLALQDHLNRSSAKVKQIIVNKIQQLDEKITALQQLKKALSKLSACCDGKGSIQACPILKTLKQEKITSRKKK